MLFAHDSFEKSGNLYPSPAPKISTPQVLYLSLLIKSNGKGCSPCGEVMPNLFNFFDPLIIAAKYSNPL